MSILDNQAPKGKAGLAAPGGHTATALSPQEQARVRKPPAGPLAVHRFAPDLLVWRTSTPADIVLGADETTIQLRGRVVYGRTPGLAAVLGDAAAIGRPVVVDLTHATSLCPHTITALLGLSTRIGQRITLRNASEAIRERLHATHAPGTFRLVTDQ